VLSLLSVYINRGRAAGVSHHVFRSWLMPLVSPASAVWRKAGFRHADEGQGHDHPSVCLSIQQCKAIHQVSSPLPVTRGPWYISPFWTYQIVEMLFFYFGKRTKVPQDPSMVIPTRPLMNMNSGAKWSHAPFDRLSANCTFLGSSPFA
jgi:hypothetical protein